MLNIIYLKCPLKPRNKRVKARLSYLLHAVNEPDTEKKNTVPPKSGLGKAIAYFLNHYQALRRYTDSGIVSIDNNVAERAIKPFAVGRKNWLFCGNTAGAIAAANIYSLIEAAKMYNMDSPSPQDDGSEYRLEAHYEVV